jgi:hypothetical protein
VETPDTRQERNKRRQDTVMTVVKRRRVTVGVVKGVLPSDFEFPQSLTA